MRITYFHLVMSLFLMTGTLMFGYLLFGRGQPQPRPISAPSVTPAPTAPYADLVLGAEESHLALARQRARDALEKATAALEEALRLGRDTTASYQLYTEARRAFPSARTASDYDMVQSLCRQAMDGLTDSRPRRPAAVPPSPPPPVVQTFAPPIPVAAPRVSPPRPAVRRGRRVLVYTVRQGDTLWSIARKVYGRGAAWAALWRANEGKVPDFDAIEPGLRLRLPGK